VRKFLLRLLRPVTRHVLSRLQRLHHRNEVAQVEGISLLETDDYTPFFRQTMERALLLIRDKDPRRYSRVQQYIVKIVNCKGAFVGASYSPQTKTCEIEFKALQSAKSLSFAAVWYASTLVHEATHGWLIAHGVDYTAENRVRSERLCVAEARRFVRRLELSAKEWERMSTKLTFDAKRWEEFWTLSPQERLRRKIERTQEDYVQELRRKPKYHIPT
jgi:hypothetical protein